MGAGFDAMVTGASIMISNLAGGTEVKFESAKTGEDPDTQKAAKVVDGPFSASGAPGPNAERTQPWLRILSKRPNGSRT